MKMSRQDRIKEYSNPTRGWHGAGRDQENLDRFADRAKANSTIAPRASDGEMKLPSTKVNQRDTAMRPYAPRANIGTDATEPNHEGGPFMRSIRRV
jgi:hypothetical protein